MIPTSYWLHGKELILFGLSYVMKGSQTLEPGFEHCPLFKSESQYSIKLGL